MEQFHHFEALCVTVVSTANVNERKNALKELERLTLSDFLVLLNNTDNNLAQFYSLSFLADAISKNWDNITFQQQVDIRDTILNCYQTKAELLSDLVIRESALVLAKLLKRGWHSPSMDVFADISTVSFMEHQRSFELILEQHLPKEEIAPKSFQMKKLGLVLLRVIVQEFSGYIGDNYPLVFHRCTCFSFRDTYLKTLFERTINELLANATSSVNNPIVPFLVELLFACFSFDFDGDDHGRFEHYYNYRLSKDTSDDTTEDDNTYSFPLSWGEFVDNIPLINCLFSIFASKIELSEKAMEIIIKIVSVRRVSYETTEIKVSQKLNTVFGGFLQIMKNTIGLDKEENFHVFCRALAQLKTLRNSMFLESSPIKIEFFTYFRNFTMKVLNSEGISENSERYLLSTWGFVVLLVLRFSVSDSEKFISSCCEDIARTSIAKLLNKCNTADTSEMIQYLTTIDELFSDLSYVPNLVRFNSYSQIVEWMSKMLSDSVNVILKENTKEKPKNYLRCALIIHLFNIILKKRKGLADSATEEIDIVLSQIVFSSLCSLSNNVYSNVSFNAITPLDVLRMAYFEFLKTSVTSFVFSSISSMASFEDGFNLIPFSFPFPSQLQKYMNAPQNPNERSLFVSNFLSFAFAHILVSIEKLPNTGKQENEIVIPVALEVLRFLIEFPCCFSFVTAHNKTLEFIVNGTITSSLFPFLKEDCEYRSVWFQTIGTIVFDNDLQTKYWEDFFYCYEQSLTISLSSESAEQKIFFVQVVLSDMIGLFRAIPNVNVYNDLFVWFKKRVFPLVNHVIYDTVSSPYLMPYETITSRTLRLFELVTRNSMHTHLFSCNSEIPLAICINSAIILNPLVQKAQLYFSKNPDITSNQYNSALKSVRLALAVYNNIIEGKYANVKAFEAFGSNTFAQLINGLLVLTFSLPFHELEYYEKLQRAFFSFIDHICTCHSIQILSEQHSALSHILNAIKMGCEKEAYEVNYSCCSALCSLLTCFYHEKKKKFKSKAYENFASFCQLPSTIQSLSRISYIVFTTCIYNGPRSLYSVAQVLLPIMNLFPDLFLMTQNSLLAQLKDEDKQLVADELKDLLRNVKPTLSFRNRMLFDQNLSAFYSHLARLRELN